MSARNHKQKDAPGLRTFLNHLIRGQLSDAQWRVLASLEEFQGIADGSQSINAWLEKCSPLLEAFGYALPQYTTDADGEPKLETEIDATREQVDWVRSRLIARRAENENADWLTGIREWRRDLSEEATVFELESLARVELIENEPENERLENLKNVLRAFEDSDLVARGVVSVEAMLGALNDSALGMLPIFLPSAGMTQYVAYFNSKSSVAEFAQAVLDIAQRYGWWPAEASAFCLFGHVPEVRSGQAVWVRHPEIPALSRIVLSIDPSWSPDEVRDLYRAEVRKHTKYPFRVSVKHLIAALFASEVAPDAPWPERYRRHSEAYRDTPELVFANAKTFKRDAEKAAKRLLEPTFSE